MATLYRFEKEDGSFDYERYRSIQVAANRAKLASVFAVEENIRHLAGLIAARGPCSFGICHGTRRGLEQKWFGEALGCRVIGTEISDTAGQFPDTIQWDFHETKPEWIGSADFVYSNSWDHSYDPKRCFSQWVRCLKPGGLMLLDHSSRHLPETVNPVDPFGASVDELVSFLNNWGRGSYAVVEIIDDLPSRTHELNVQSASHMVLDIRTVVVQKTP